MKTRNLILAAFAALTLLGNMHAQSLLTEQPETPVQRTARELLIAPRQTRDVLLNQLDDASQRLWSSPDPQAVLDALGPKAGPLFNINSAFGQLVGAFLTAQGDAEGLQRLGAIAARLRPHTVHADGTITITPLPTPTPTQQ